MNNKFTGILVCFFLSACASASATPTATVTAETQSMIFFNGVILTMDEGLSQAQAIAIRDGKIVAVGPNEEILALRESDTKIIDLKGLTLMPGFVDAHTHILNDARSQGMSLDEAQALALQNGITAIGDLFVNRSFLREMQEFEQQGLLRVRTSLYLVYNDPCGRVLGDWYMDYVPTRSPGEMLRINGVKIFTDGGSCGRPALSFEAENGAGLGDLWMSQDELNEAVAEAQSAGYQVAIHAIGDRAVARAQQAIAFALDGQPNTYRHRMEHISVLQPEMVKRFGALDIVTVIPGIYPSCNPFGPPLPEQYGDWEWPWKDLRETNPELKIAWHSDFPFWQTNPFSHLYGFVTRRDVFSYYTCGPEEWLKDDTLSVDQALSIMTIESAYALFREQEVGSLVPGKYADVVILSKNPRSIEPDELRNIKVLGTIVNGKFEFCAPNQSALCPGYSNRLPTPLPDTRPPEPISWLIAILVIALPIGFIQRGRSNRSLFIKAAGASGILSGLFLFAMYPLVESNSAVQEWIILLALVFLTISAAGMMLLKRSARAIAILLIVMILGAVITVEGAIVSVWLGQDEYWPIMLFGGFLLLVGMLLFGLANLRARIFPRLNWVPFLTSLLSLFSLVLLLLRDFSQPEYNFPLLAYLIILGSGWAIMGILLLPAKEE